MPELDFAYYGWAIMLLIGSGIAWTTNFFTLPGNWFIVGLAALFVSAQATGDAAQGMNWEAVAFLFALAAGGEAVEFFAGAAGAAKQGGSRRAILLAIVGTFAGSIAGAVMGVPIPILGPLLGALVGGAGGAFAGAYLGEMWKHGGADRSMSVGWGAAVGRVLGTLGKLLVGVVMMVVLTVRVFS
ncbi:MAG: DUF456 family protein [Hyphomicrobiaceae bacterium]|nr:DUF456 family protein [Hyphomicrobiaceae bacterium]